MAAVPAADVAAMAAVLRRTRIPRSAALGERAGRLAGRPAVVVGGGQTRGSTVGNGRAVALLFAREGANILVADRDPDSARETADLIRSEGGRHRRSRRTSSASPTS
jgi:shikimate 5-dehydrogenase